MPGAAAVAPEDLLADWLADAMGLARPLSGEARIEDVDGVRIVPAERALAEAAARIAPFALPAVLADVAGAQERPYSVGRGMLLEIGAFFDFGFSIYLIAPKVAGYIEHVPEGRLPGPLPDLPHPFDFVTGP